MSLKINKSQKMDDILKKFPNNLTQLQYEELSKEATEYLINKWNIYILQSNLSDTHKNTMKKACKLYLEKMFRLGFIDKDNIKYVLELLENNIRGFSKVDHDYAAWDEFSGIIKYNESNSFTEERAIRTIFHEFNHSLIRLKLEGRNPIFEISKDSHGHIKLNNKSMKITLPNYQNISGILDEYLAEEMAQQLWYEDDRNRPPKTIVTQYGGLQFGRPIYSNLESGYNRCYQQVTEEFLKNIKGVNTVNNNSNEKRARALFRVCLSNDDIDIATSLYKQYNSTDERHKRKLFITLGNIVGRVGNNKITLSELCYTDSEIFEILEREHIKENHTITIRNREDIEER